MNKTERLKANLRAPKPTSNHLPYDQGLSTGSTLLNLAFTSKPNVGLLPGLCYSFVGDSSSGKTVLALSVLAEASVNPAFNDYRLIFDNAEGGALMDMKKYFGEKAADRLEPPAGTSDDPEHSDTLEEFYDHLDNAAKDGRPFVWVLDSMDALWTEDEEEQLAKEATAREKGKTISGSYGTAKAKTNSARLRVACNNLRKTGSMLILISQTRDNIGWGSQFNPKTYSGGRAIRFYSRIQLWTSIREDLKARHGGKDRHVGIVSQIKVTKNHICGWEGKVEVPILRGYGVDDLGACVNYLIEEGRWTETKGRIEVPELGVSEGKTREQLIEHIESSGEEQKLRDMVAAAWMEVEAACEAKRKPRYA